MHDCFGGNVNVIYATYGNDGFKRWRRRSDYESNLSSGELQCCNYCKINEECIKETLRLIGFSTLENPSTTYAHLAEVRKKRQLEFQLENLSISKRHIMTDVRLKNLPENWFDTAKSSVSEDVLAQIRAARVKVDELELSLDDARGQLRKLQTANYATDAIVTKKNGVFRCAYSISIDEGEVVPDFSNVQLFSETSGESNINQVDKSLAAEILDKLKKKLSK